MAPSSKGRKSSSKKKGNQKNDNGLQDEIILLFVLAISVLMLLSNFGLIHAGFGDAVAGVMFGLFGVMSYLAPIILFVVTAFLISNKENKIAVMKAVSGVVLFITLCAFTQLLFGENETVSAIKEFYTLSSANREGGGIVGGAVSWMLVQTIDVLGTYVVLIVLVIVCVVLITERSFFGGVKRAVRRFIIQQKTMYKEEKKSKQNVHDKEKRHGRMRLNLLNLSMCREGIKRLPV